MEKIWRQILESSLFIADMTSANANFLYELGVANTLGKSVIILTQDDRYVPTDLKAIEYVRYRSQAGYEEEFKNRLQIAMRHTLGVVLWAGQQTPHCDARSWRRIPRSPRRS